MADLPAVCFVVAPYFNRMMPHHGVAYLRARLEELGAATTYHDLSSRYRHDPFIQAIFGSVSPGQMRGETLYSGLPAALGGCLGTTLDDTLGQGAGMLLTDWAETCATSILDERPQVVAFSLYESTLFFTLGLARRLKARDPSLLIVFGGPLLADFAAVRLLARLTDLVDFIIVGEGEEVLASLILHLSGQGSGVRQSCIRTADGVPTVPPEAQFVDRLDRLAPPTYRDVPFDVYRDNLRQEPGFTTCVYASGEIILPISFGRGCPFRCAFCGHNAYWSTHRVRSVESVVSELQALEAEYGCRVFRVNDSLVNVRTAWLVDFCEALSTAGLDVFWYGHARASGIDEEIATKMYDAGCRYLKFGLESGSNRVLRLMNKKATVQEQERGLAAAHRAGIKTRVSFVYNFPGEQEEDLDETIGFIRRNSEQIDGIRVFETFLVPQSDLALRPDEHRIALDTRWPTSGALAEALDGLPWRWRPLDLSADQMQARHERVLSAFDAVWPSSLRRHLPPAFPEIMEDALTNDTVVEIPDVSSSPAGPDLAEPEARLEHQVIEAIGSTGRTLSDVARVIGASPETVRERVLHLMAIGRAAVRAKET